MPSAIELIGLGAGAFVVSEATGTTNLLGGGGEDSGGGGGFVIPPGLIGAIANAGGAGDIPSGLINAVANAGGGGTTVIEKAVQDTASNATDTITDATTAYVPESSRYSNSSGPLSFQTNNQRSGGGGGGYNLSSRLFSPRSLIPGPEEIPDGAGVAEYNAIERWNDGIRGVVSGETIWDRVKSEAPQTPAEFLNSATEGLGPAGTIGQKVGLPGGGGGGGSPSGSGSRSTPSVKDVADAVAGGDSGSAVDTSAVLDGGGSGGSGPRGGSSGGVDTSAVLEGGGSTGSTPMTDKREKKENKKNKTKGERRSGWSPRGGGL